MFHLWRSKWLWWPLSVLGRYRYPSFLFFRKIFFRRYNFFRLIFGFERFRRHSRYIRVHIPFSIGAWKVVKKTTSQLLGNIYVHRAVGAPRLFGDISILLAVGAPRLLRVVGTQLPLLGLRDSTARGALRLFLGDFTQRGVGPLLPLGSLRCLKTRGVFRIFGFPAGLFLNPLLLFTPSPWRGILLRGVFAPRLPLHKFI